MLENCEFTRVNDYFESKRISLLYYFATLLKKITEYDTFNRRDESSRF
jgi:hypothetical protein